MRTASLTVLFPAIHGALVPASLSFGRPEDSQLASPIGFLETYKDHILSTADSTSTSAISQATPAVSTTVSCLSTITNNPSLNTGNSPTSSWKVDGPGAPKLSPSSVMLDSTKLTATSSGCAGQSMAHSTSVTRPTASTTPSLVCSIKTSAASSTSDSVALAPPYAPQGIPPGPEGIPSDFHSLSMLLPSKPASLQWKPAPLPMNPTSLKPAATSKPDPGATVITSVMKPYTRCPYPYPHIYCGKTKTTLIAMTSKTK
ncbi:hypothetical protein BKA58DRAFT_460818 [Alternaria rosae]|uniref:uncharacterized protein n=1 Tax=Alternaria rosae TaxID=1187941 RepID=UPI001E8D5CBE|nr:uncharacterized protein BKA58DRAFT_460818 [Alternaria rosae]KAH6866904.1 hypothetical protein BKA58DRAFT_460818 [Alternaria rosae]